VIERAEAATTLHMETLIDTQWLKISFEAGSEHSQEAVIAFTGVGLGLGGIQKEEFARSLHQCGQLRDVYYVIDKTRSWFNSTHEEIIGFFQSRLQDKRVITLGNSMGGFGAVLFSEQIPCCDTALAFCPQYSVHPEIVPFENRWTEHLSKITTWNHPTCLPSQKVGIRKIILFGANDPLDRRHRILFEQHESNELCVYVIQGCAHDVGAFLKQKNILGEVILCATDSHDPLFKMDQIFQRNQVHYSRARRG
jgi:hypothetical protein